MPRRDLRDTRGSFEMSTPSMRIAPVSRGDILNSVTIKLLLPLPVRPAIPIFSLGCSEADRFCKSRGQGAGAM